MDNKHAQVVEQPGSPGGYLLFNLGVLVRVGDSGVDQCSPSQCRVWQQPYAKPHYTKFATSTQCIESLLMHTNLFPWM